MKIEQNWVYIRKSFLLYYHVITVQYCNLFVKLLLYTPLVISLQELCK